MTDLLQSYLAVSWRMTAVLVAWLLVRLVLRGRTPARLLAFGWVIILAGLLLPWRWPSALSPFNWLPAAPAAAAATVLTEPETGSLANPAALPSDPAPAHARIPGMPPGSAAPAMASSFPGTPAVWLGLWLTGVVLLAGLRAWRWIDGGRILRRGPADVTPGLTEQVRACARELAITESVGVRESDAVGAPAICGLRRPVLLFPVGLAAQLTPGELRLVILHELGHWRRRDLWLHEAALLVRALHWFNPLVWLAARLARDDAEAACDEFVMRRMSSRDTPAYGAALLKVLGMARGQTGCPVGLGIFGNKQKLQHRIHMIAQYQRPGAWRTLLGASALAALLAVSLTRELHAQATPPAAPAPAGEITTIAPAGWWRNGQNAANYTVGVDGTQPHVRPASAYVRSNGPGKENDFGGMMQAFDASDYHGKRLRYTAWMKTKDAANGAQLWMRVDGKIPGQSLQFDNMDRRPHPMGTTDWQFCEVVLDVPPEATAVALGFFIKQTGQAWVNDAKVEVVDESVPVTDMTTSQSGRKLPAAPANLEFAVGQ